MLCSFLPHVYICHFFSDSHIHIHQLNFSNSGAPESICHLYEQLIKSKVKNSLFYAFYLIFFLMNIGLYIFHSDSVNKNWNAIKGSRAKYITGKRLINHSIIL